MKGHLLHVLVVYGMPIKAHAYCSIVVLIDRMGAGTT